MLLGVAARLTQEALEQSTKVAGAMPVHHEQALPTRQLARLATGWHFSCRYKAAFSRRT